MMITRVLVVLLLACASARAADPTVAADLAESERRYGDLDYRGAAETAGRAARNPAATTSEQARGWERAGLSWLVLGQRNLAKESFDRLFTLDPARVVSEPSLSPRQRAFIDEVRKGHPAPTPKPVVEEPAPTAVAQPPTVADKKPIWKRWYLWAPIAVVVVGVGVGLGVGLGLHHDTGPSGTLGSTGLALRF